ncbi:MAG: PadR family transcriptional regulator [Ruminococcaceae bacterium]|nr:PadR family transcriptional regulator [Oscillospiraceae bacterium]
MKKQSIEHTQLLILSLLAARDMYGYEMILELARRSQNVFEMKEGTLYPVLHGLEKQRYVEAYEQEAQTGRVRKYYRLTRAGRDCLADEKASWERYAGAVNAVLRAETV